MLKSNTVEAGGTGCQETYRIFNSLTLYHIRNYIMAQARPISVSDVSCSFLSFQFGSFRASGVIWVI